ncbi:hypothetical protein MRB53_039773 [Persea americana]|nr:hypothetical protein MRB53_039773 [Persea americana]
MLFLPLLTGLVTALPTARKYAVKESMPVHQAWKTVDSVVEDGHQIRLRIGLAQPNLDVVQSKLYEVSDPEHENYGKHLSQADLKTLTRPHQSTYDKVLGWLAEHGIQTYDVEHDWITLTIPVSHAEQLLATKYEMFEHVDGHRVLRTKEYSLPVDLHEHIDLIQPTTMLGSLHQHRSHIMPQPDLSTATPLNLQNTPASLRKLYNIGSYTAKSPKSAIGIASFLNQSAQYADFDQFINTYAPQEKGYTFKTVSINGGTERQDATDTTDAVEANLDTQFAFSLAYPMPATQFSVGGMPPFKPDLVTPTDTNEPYLDFIQYLQSAASIPNTISVSYGDDEQTVPLSYAQKVCSGFMQLGARGSSILISSGDFGVGGGGATSPPTNCVSNDGKSKPMFLPAFPASCPWVTSVGATYLNPEVAVFSFASGGGFSNYFSVPSYQASAVAGYKKYIPAAYTLAGLYNTSGRGYPDVAAQGDQFQVYVGGAVEPVSGTSASAPTFAGVIALVNDVLLSSGKPSLGFLNPFLYGKGKSGLNDILVGTNYGCGTPGFSCAPGWDPVYWKRKS